MSAYVTMRSRWGHDAHGRLLCTDYNTHRCSTFLTIIHTCTPQHSFFVRLWRIFRHSRAWRSQSRTRCHAVFQHRFISCYHNVFPSSIDTRHATTADWPDDRKISYCEPSLYLVHSSHGCSNAVSFRFTEMQRVVHASCHDRSHAIRKVNFIQIE